MSTNTTNRYTTSDIALAAYLKLKGSRLVDCGKDGQKFSFIFDDPNNICEDLALEFANSDCRRYDDEMRSLKKVLYNKGKRG